jgi:hypothetical protein
MHSVCVLQLRHGAASKIVCTMNLYRRSSRPKPQAEGPRGRRPPPPGGDGSNAVQHRPDPKAEPIPDGEHKYVPRSPYRTGNY